MSVALGLSGWLLAVTGIGAAAIARVRLARHAEAVARASHEVRGPLTAVAAWARAGDARSRSLPWLVYGRSSSNSVAPRVALDDLAVGAGAGGPPSGARSWRWANCWPARWRRGGPCAARARGRDRSGGGVGPVLVAGERLRLAQAVGNLLANAIEHGGGAVDVGTRAAAGSGSDRSGGRRPGPAGADRAADPAPGPARGGRTRPRHQTRQCDRGRPRRRGSSAAPGARGARLVLELPHGERPGRHRARLARREVARLDRGRPGRSGCRSPGRKRLPGCNFAPMPSAQETMQRTAWLAEEIARRDGRSAVRGGPVAPGGRNLGNGLHRGRAWVIVGQACMRCGTRVAGLLPPSHPGSELRLPAPEPLNSVDRLPRNLRARARRQAPTDDPVEVPRRARRGAWFSPPPWRRPRRRRARCRSGRPRPTTQYTTAALAGINPLSPKARDLKRFFFNYSHDTELDSAHRVMVPPMLMEYAGLDKDVVVTGSGECLEVFDRAAYDALQQRRSHPCSRHCREPWRHCLT